MKAKGILTMIELHSKTSGDRAKRRSEYYKNELINREKYLIKQIKTLKNQLINNEKEIETIRINKSS